jgi:hypothetical protein
MAITEVGTVTLTEVTKNRDSEKNVLMCQTVITDPTDVQDVELITQAGVDYNPPPNATLVITQVGAAWKIGIACDDGIEPEVNPGEYQIYSSATGVKKAKITLGLDGTITCENTGGSITLDPTGVVEVNSSVDSAGLTSKIDTFISTLDTVFRTGWVVLPNDGGAALKAAYITAFGTPPATVASQSLKVDQ